MSNETSETSELERAPKNYENLGFKLDAELNREFRECAFKHGLKLNELLRRSLAAFQAIAAYNEANP